LPQIEKAPLAELPKSKRLDTISDFLSKHSIRQCDDSSITHDQESTHFGLFDDLKEDLRATKPQTSSYS
jgi:hypothetical protein